ncbi:MAG: hypothetical protein C0395_08170 [Gemmatimonas sp.]|nr:hypothetical protein [Gemmatimonas sp.]
MKTRRSFVVLGLAAALAGLVWGCSDQSPPTEPLSGIEVRDGAVLSGTVLDTGGRPAPDAVLALERLEGGLSATVGRALTGDSSPPTRPRACAARSPTARAASPSTAWPPAPTC